MRDFPVFRTQQLGQLIQRFQGGEQIVECEMRRHFLENTGFAFLNGFQYCSTRRGLVYEKGTLMAWIIGGFHQAFVE